MNYLYVVDTKEKLITVRALKEVRDDFKIAAGLRGATMSGLLYQFIMRTIREEKAISPQSFGKLKVVSPVKIASPKAEVRRRFQEEITSVGHDGKLSGDQLPVRKRKAK